MYQFSLSFKGFDGDLEKRQDEIRSKFLELIHYDRTPGGKLVVEKIEETEIDGLPARRYFVRKSQWDPQPVYEIPPATTPNGLTVLAFHGHGTKPFSGIYDYIPGLARRGYRVLIPILFGTMERETKGMKPDLKNMCREWEIEAHVLGPSLLGVRLYDASLSLALAMELDGVDRERIGCMGLSMGGELAIYLPAIEQRIRAIVSAGFLSTFPNFMLKIRGCQCYSIRDWPAYFDMPDIASCIAPRPLQIQKGLEDPCFDHQDVGRAFTHLKEVYQQFGVEGNTEYRSYPGKHCLNLDLADAWLREHLAV